MLQMRVGVWVQVAEARTQNKKERSKMNVAIGDGDATEAERKCWNAQQLWVWARVWVLVWVDQKLTASSSAVPCGGRGGGQGSSEVVTCRRTPCPQPRAFTAQHSTV